MGLQNANVHIYIYYFTFYFSLGLKIIWMQEIIETEYPRLEGAMRIMLYPKPSFFLFVDKVHFHCSKQRKWPYILVPFLVPKIRLWN